MGSYKILYLLNLLQEFWHHCFPLQFHTVFLLLFELHEHSTYEFLEASTINCGHATAQISGLSYLGH